ncbi:hypothetical protein [Sinanaerobacter chloroacetimidivorans]|uniref:Uncharacterized protein n=1 Tax=Sinanaerobacter chloroacetimidivorans TaxID=2818044 RepID=A0A8J8B5D1_9FIRM|nr:hypothetical protein [Sinanaerobacter chloroacetimidivorans]MBR0600220.1 hypothetical protein [Sinanaerobacter chloroacetimidivorans]
MILSLGIGFASDSLRSLLSVFPLQLSLRKKGIGFASDSLRSLLSVFINRIIILYKIFYRMSKLED